MDPLCDVRPTVSVQFVVVLGKLNDIMSSLQNILDCKPHSLLLFEVAEKLIQAATVSLCGLHVCQLCFVHMANMHG